MPGVRVSNELNIDVCGRGRDVVMLHGWATHSAVFQPLVDVLQREFRLHLVDLPGHGRNRDCGLPLCPETVAAALIDRLPNAVWLGWSLGGLIALTAALKNPDSVERLVLMNASPCLIAQPHWPAGVGADWFAEFLAGVKHRKSHALQRFYALCAAGSASAVTQLRYLKTVCGPKTIGSPKTASRAALPRRQALIEGLKALRDYDYSRHLHRIRIPVLILGSEQDKVVPAAATDMLAGHLVRGQGHMIAGAGHLPFLSHTDVVLDHLRRFLSPERKLAHG